MDQVHITHLILVAIRPDFVNEHHLVTEMARVQVDGESLKYSPNFTPSSGLANLCAATTETLKDEHPIEVWS